MSERLKPLDHKRYNEKTEKLGIFLTSRLIGQERAIKTIIGAYDASLSPIRTKGGPILIALFLGPSGVGKTYVAKLLAEYFFGNQWRFTKIECASYKERHQLSQLIGAPPGYIGYENFPMLAQSRIDRPFLDYYLNKFIKEDEVIKAAWLEIRELQKEASGCSGELRKMLLEGIVGKKSKLENIIRHKALKIGARVHSVVLFDEIEKAHSAVHDFLLEVASEGRATLANGNITNFEHSFIILTSNAGSKIIANKLRRRGEIGLVREQVVKGDIFGVAMKELEKRFNPEFLGRIKRGIVVFHELTSQQLLQIINLRLAEFQDNLSRAFPIELFVAEIVKKFILQESLDHPQYGARLLEDKLNDHLIEPLNRLINSQQIREGDRIFIGLDDKKEGVKFLKDMGIRMSSKERELSQKISEQISGLK